MKPSWNQRKRQHEATEREQGGDDVTDDPATVLDLPAGDPGVVADAPAFNFEKQDSDSEGVPTPVGEDDVPLLPHVHDEGEDEPKVELPEVQPVQRPTLAEYETKWAAGLAKHSKSNDEAFGAENLCPKPVPQLWQNAPHIAFHELKSPAAQGRLALCRPISGLQESAVVDGLEKYAHISGDVFFSRRAETMAAGHWWRSVLATRFHNVVFDNRPVVTMRRPSAWQVASTMGFVLNKNTGSFMGLTQEEERALHEVLTWGAQRGNNPILRWFGPELASFDESCRRLIAAFNNPLPEGSLKARIRCTTRECKHVKDGALGDPLGEEAEAMVMIDFQGHPTLGNGMFSFRGGRLVTTIPWRRAVGTRSDPPCNNCNPEYSL